MLEASTVAVAMAPEEVILLVDTQGGRATGVAEATSVVVDPTREVDLELLEAMEVVVMVEATPRVARALVLAGVRRSYCIRVGSQLNIFTRLSTITTAFQLRRRWCLLG